MRHLSGSIALLIAILGGVQCTGGSEPDDQEVLVGRIANASYSGDAEALLVRQSSGADTLILFGSRPHGAGPMADERIAVAAEVTAIATGSFNAKADIYHLAGGDVVVGSYGGSGTIEIEAFTGTDSIIRGRLDFTAANTASHGTPRYGASVAFQFGVFRARLRVSDRD